jgi:hypothetical protein
MDEQMILLNTEDEMQRATYTLNTIAIKYNLQISVEKATAMKGKMNVRTKIVINNNIIEQVNSLNYLGYTFTV